MARRRSRGRPAPLSPAQREKLAFFRRWRRVLRLRLDAREARLVDRPEGPVDPALLDGLLARVDRPALQAALQRKPLSEDAAQRARFLAEAAALTADPGILLDALEAHHSLPIPPELPKTIARAAAGLDLGRISHARLARLLVAIDQVLPGPEALATAFALLGRSAFRAALRKAAPRLPAPTRRAWLPLAAVHEALDGGEPAPDALEAGLRRLLDAPPGVLDQQPARVRFGLVSAALALDATWPLESPNIDRIVSSLDRGDLAWAGLAFSTAAGHVRLGRYDRARRLLDQVLAHHPGDLRAAALLTWLLRPRRGPLALASEEGGALRPGYDLSRLAPVWVRLDADPEGAAIHRQLDLPGIAPAVQLGAEAGRPWVAVDGSLPLLSEALLGLDRRAALQIAAAGVRIAALLSRLGLTLPDLGPGRLLVDSSPSRRWLLLADLTGARRQPADLAEAHQRTLAARFARAALADPAFTEAPVRADLPAPVARKLDGLLARPLPMPALTAWLDQV